MIDNNFWIEQYERDKSANASINSEANTKLIAYGMITIACLIWMINSSEKETRNLLFTTIESYTTSHIFSWLFLIIFGILTIKAFINKANSKSSNFPNLQTYLSQKAQDPANSLENFYIEGKRKSNVFQFKKSLIDIIKYENGYLYISFQNNECYNGSIKDFSFKFTRLQKPTTTYCTFKVGDSSKSFELCESNLSKQQWDVVANAFMCAGSIQGVNALKNRFRITPMQAASVAFKVLNNLNKS